MYCEYCGAKMKAAFCPKCGKKRATEDAENTTTIATKDNHGEKLSNTVVKVHLQDLLVVELAVKKLNELIKSNREQSDEMIELGVQCEKPDRPYEPRKPQEPRAPKLSDSKDYWQELYGLAMCCLYFAFLGAVIGCFPFSCFLGLTFKLVINFALIGIGVGVVFYLLGIILRDKNDDPLPISPLKRFLEYCKKRDDYFDRILPEYEKALEKYEHESEIFDNKTLVEYHKQLEIKTAEHEKQLTQLDRKHKELVSDLEKAKSMLAKAYAANIVPNKYRGLLPIYFLYDYMSSSRETLENALLHCQLDKLEQQLSAVIRNEQEMILNDYIMIAKQDEIISNQESLIRSANRAEAQRATMINNGRAMLSAQRDMARSLEEDIEYNKITAINTSVMAYFSTWDHM